MNGKSFWKEHWKTAVIAVSLVLNCVLAGASYTYYNGWAQKLTENNALQQTCDRLESQTGEKDRKISELQAQVDEMQPTIDQLQAQVDSLTSGQNALQETTAAQPAPQTEAPAAAPAAEDSSYDDTDSGSYPQGETVYVTDHGSKYHSAGCRYLHNSCNAISLEEAERQGYTACSVCGG